MNYIDTRDPIAVAVVNAIQTGDIPTLTHYWPIIQGYQKQGLGIMTLVVCPGLYCM
jgi:hypothetical protein